MSDVNGIGKGKISLNTESFPQRIERRSPEFAERLKSASLEVNTTQHNGDAAAEGVIKGEVGIHEGLMALSRANTSFRLLAQTRNKVMTAYNEIMRMQI